MALCEFTNGIYGFGIANASAILQILEIRFGIFRK